MIERILLDLVPSYEAAALEARLSTYLWMTWPDVFISIMEKSLTNVRI